MILEQLYLGCLAQASYFIADPKSGTAVVVDPRRDVDVYLDLAKTHGVRIEHVLLTHFHADFLAGHLELRERVGATLHLGAKAQAEFAFEPMKEGGELVLGPDVRLSFLETPGHTPESMSIVVFDAETGAAPHAVLTGDTLFIGDVGRPDLMSSVGVTKEELASAMFDSLHDKLMPLPDETLVYPGHGAGSMCGKNLSTDTVSTIGAQRANNYALQPMDRAEFIGLVTANQPKAPAYFGFDADLNRRERATLDTSLGSFRTLGLDELVTLRAEGVIVLDTREASAFAAAHIANSINVGLDGKFATWCGTVIEPGSRIALVCEPGTERQAAVRLGRIGYDKVVGYLEGGIQTAREREDLIASFERLQPSQLEGFEGELVDIRGPGERESGKIEGSRSLPLPELRERIDELPRDKPILLQCQSGYRSAVAASLLLSEGFSDVSDLAGGYLAWEELTARA